VLHPGAVMMIPLFDDGTVLMERQFRYPVGEVMLEFPAGKLDPRRRAALRRARAARGNRLHRARWDYLTRIHP
jgi:ADP-ribose pyrophosphatase